MHCLIRARPRTGFFTTRTHGQVRKRILASTICWLGDNLATAEGRHGFRGGLQSIAWCGCAPVEWRDVIMGRGRDFRGGGKGRRSFDEEAVDPIAPLDLHQPRPPRREPLMADG